jgi:excisionase family DNA binding protein
MTRKVSMSGTTLEAEAPVGDWLTPPEVAVVAKVGMTTVRAWLRSRALRSYRPGGTKRVLVHRDELDEFIRRGEAAVAG